MLQFGKTTLVLVAGATIATLAAGCSSIRDHRGYLVDSALIDSVRMGLRAAREASARRHCSR